MINEDKINEAAKYYHDSKSDNYTLPWMKQKPNYRTQTRKMFRDVIYCLNQTGVRVELDD